MIWFCMSFNKPSWLKILSQCSQSNFSFICLCFSSGFLLNFLALITLEIPVSGMLLKIIITRGDNCGRGISFSSRVSNASSQRLRVLFLIFHHIIKLVNVCQSWLYSFITKSSHLRILKAQLYSQSMLF